MMKTLTSWFVLASLAGSFLVRTVATLANATFITLTSQPGDFVGAGTNQIFTGMYVRDAPVGSIAVPRS
jgi:hypothetical protein